MPNDSWQSAWVEVLPDFSGFAKTANSRMTGILGPAGTAGGVLAGNMFKGSFLQILGGVLGANIVTGIGYSIGRLIGNAVGAGIAFGVGAVSLASDLEQSMGAIDAVFKDQSTVIDEFSRSAASNLGLSRAVYQSFATVVGAQLKNLGIPFEKVSGQTNDLLELGADLAAQFGGPTADAVRAISSVLRGERDPIERYGVSIKQSDINARLAAAGMGKLTGEARKQAEIQATLAILYSQTADAQGTFAREGDTLAGQQQRLQASLEDTQTKLGTALLPAFTSLASFANEHLIPRLDGLISRVGPKLQDALEKAGPKFEELMEKAGPLFEGFISAAADGIPDFIGALGDLMDAIAVLNKFWKDYTESDWFKFWRDFGSQLGQIATDGGPMTQGVGEKLQERLRLAGEDSGQAFADGLAAKKRAAEAGFFGTTESISGMAHQLGGELKQKLDDAGFDAGQGFQQSVIDAIDIDTLFRSGQRLAEGLAAGIDSRAARVSEAALKAAQGGVISIDKYLKIASPSKVTEKQGGFFSEGMALGISGKAWMVEDAVKSLVPLPNIAAGASMTIASSVTESSGGATGPMRIEGSLDLGNGLVGIVKGVLSSQVNTALAKTVGSR